MLGPKILPGILVVLPATLLLTAQSGFGESTSEECRTSPGASAPAGSDGMQISGHGDLVSLKPRHENVAK
jgi:hypothetical protein